MIESLFISKNSGELHELRDYSERHELKLTAHSFLEFRPLNFTIERNYEVIFFSSPRAVLFFHSRYSINSNALIASVGGTTTALLNKMGHEVAFDGKDFGSISAVGRGFATWLEGRSVLFPVSTKSIGTISNQIPQRQTQIVACYETAVVPKSLDSTYDYYVFTSPSNVEGFFASNKLPELCSLVAWGESTATALRRNTTKEVHTLAEPSTEALIAYLDTK